MKSLKKLINLGIVLSLSFLIFACGMNTNVEPKFPGTVAVFSADNPQQQVAQVTGIDRGSNQCQLVFDYINAQNLGISAANALNPTLNQGIGSINMRIIIGTQKSGGAAHDFLIPGVQNSVGLQSFGSTQPTAQFYIDQRNPAGNNLTPTFNFKCSDIKVLQFQMNGSALPVFVQNL